MSRGERPDSTTLPASVLGHNYMLPILQEPPAPTCARLDLVVDRVHQPAGAAAGEAPDQATEVAKQAADRTRAPARYFRRRNVGGHEAERLDVEPPEVDRQEVALPRSRAGDVHC